MSVNSLAVPTPATMGNTLMVRPPTNNGMMGLLANSVAIGIANAFGGMQMNNNNTYGIPMNNNIYGTPMNNNAFGGIPMNNNNAFGGMQMNNNPMQVPMGFQWMNNNNNNNNNTNNANSTFPGT